jgi:hypothetical protein
MSLGIHIPHPMFPFWDPLAIVPVV